MAKLLLGALPPPQHFSLVSPALSPASTDTDTETDSDTGLPADNDDATMAATTDGVIASTLLTSEEVAQYVRLALAVRSDVIAAVRDALTGGALLTTTPGGAATATVVTTDSDPDGTVVTTEVAAPGSDQVVYGELVNVELMGQVPVDPAAFVDVVARKHY